MAFSPLRQVNLFGRSGGPSIAPQPTTGAFVKVARMTITHAMHLAGGNFTIVPGIAGSILWPVAWCLLKPTFGVVYAPTNTTFNLRLGAVATNIATGLSPQVTSATARLDMGIAASALNLGAGTITNIVGQPLVVNCGAANGAGSAGNNPIIAVVEYMVIPASGLGSPFP